MVPPGADLNVDLGFATAGTVVAGVRVEIYVEWGWVGLRVTVGVEEGDKERLACKIDGGKIVIGEVCSPVKQGECVSSGMKLGDGGAAWQVGGHAEAFILDDLEFFKERGVGVECGRESVLEDGEDELP